MKRDERLRIRVVPIQHYVWPFLAILEERDPDGSWHELDAWGGDTADEARETLCTENRTAARL